MAAKKFKTGDWVQQWDYKGNYGYGKSGTITGYDYDYMGKVVYTMKTENGTNITGKAGDFKKVSKDGSSAAKYKVGDTVVHKNLGDCKITGLVGSNSDMDYLYEGIVVNTGYAHQSLGEIYFTGLSSGASQPADKPKSGTNIFKATPNYDFKLGDKVKNKTLGIEGSTLIIAGEKFDGPSGKKFIKCAWDGQAVTANVALSDLMFWGSADEEAVKEEVKNDEPTTGDYVNKVGTPLVGKIETIYDDDSVWIKDLNVGGYFTATNVGQLKKLDKPKFLPGDYAYPESIHLDVYKISGIAYFGGKLTWKANSVTDQGTLSAFEVNNDSFPSHNSKYPQNDNQIAIANKAGAPLFAGHTPKVHEEKSSTYEVGDWVKTNNGLVAQITAVTIDISATNGFSYDVSKDGQSGSGWQDHELTPAKSPKANENTKYKFNVGDLVTHSASGHDVGSTVYEITKQLVGKKGLEPNYASKNVANGIKFNEMTENFLKPYVKQEKKSKAKFKIGDVVNHSSVAKKYKYEIITVNDAADEVFYEIKEQGAKYTHSGVYEHKLTLTENGLDDLKKQRDELLKKMKEDTVTLDNLMSEIAALESGLGT